ncbi:hypothetical protein HQ36_01755 [Porphyromonas gingivicanis]|uniref:DNA primase n=1 Tax=Porphyromonas gingivicanis TaxID=266762 RepID=A0A0A2G9X9_9PORP|nr:DNA primase [Porphyromonas gingivicanis]KGN99200.1 hypothetical protein HQ36_01755 [Porphyromonas gingivicanis]
MIDEVTKQRILDTANIVDVVSDFVSLRRSGVNYVGLCPFHADRRPSFHVSPSKNICKCFACNEGGTPVSFLMKLEKMSYYEALRYLAHKYNIEINEREETEEERRRRNEQESMFLVQKFACQYFQHQLSDSEEGQTIAMPYLRHRGITPQIIEKFALGYSTSQRDGLLQKATSEGYNPQYLYATGLCFEPTEGRTSGDRFRERIIFPVHSVSGRVVAFGGRIMVNKDKTAKYINSPENAIYSKSRELYGLYLAKKAISQADKVFLVEGYMDVIAMHQAGIENVVASSGTALTTQQIRLIQRFTQHITLLFDGDAPGIKAAMRGVDLLLEAGMHVKVLLLPEGEDPDSFVRQRSVSEFNEYIEQHEVDFISFKTELYRTEMAESPMKRAEVLNELVRTIALIPDVVERSVYTQSMARNLFLSEQTLLQQVKITRNNRYAQQQRIATPHPSAEAPQPTPPVVEAPKMRTRLSKGESDLLRLLVRYGDVLIPVELEEGVVTDTPIGMYIKMSIEEELQGAEPSTFSIMFAEAGERMEASKEFRPSAYFANHEEPVIADLTVDLLSDRYQLSSTSRRALNIDNENEMPSLQQLIDDTLRCIRAFHAEHIQAQLQACHHRLQEAQRRGDNEALMNAMQELNELNKIKMSYAHELGERMILGS